MMLPTGFGQVARIDQRYAARLAGESSLAASQGRVIAAFLQGRMRQFLPTLAELELTRTAAGAERRFIV